MMTRRNCYMMYLTVHDILLYTMDAPSLEAFKARLDVALGSLVWRLATLHIAGGWNWMIIMVLFNPGHSVILWWVYGIIKIRYWKEQNSWWQILIKTPSVGTIPGCCNWQQGGLLFTKVSFGKRCAAKLSLQITAGERVQLWDTLGVQEHCCKSNFSLVCSLRSSLYWECKWAPLGGCEVGLS